MEVIPFVLSEEDVKFIPPYILERIASCSTEAVLKRVEEYLNNEQVDKSLKNVVYASFYERLDERGFRSDENLLEDVLELDNLKVTDIYFERDEEYLNRIKTNILKVIKDERAVPYVAPIKSDVIKSVISELRSIYKETNNSAYKKIADKLDKSKFLFKEPHTRGYKGTPFKNIMQKQVEYNVFCMGIDFILEKKKAGDNPKSWRFL